jgi:creatinine amidohydrolase
MRYWIVSILMTLLLMLGRSGAQTKLSAKWEELTAGDFKEAIVKAQGTCLLPFGILEKHGPHLPLGTDLLNARYVAEHAAQEEYAIISPEYFAGQISEAKHEPGTIAYSPELQLCLLQETSDRAGQRVHLRLPNALITFAGLTQNLRELVLPWIRVHQTTACS